MLWEHEPQASVSTGFSMQVLPNFHKCFYNSIETENRFSISFRKHRDKKKKRKQLVNFDYQNINSLCSRHHYVNSAH